MNHHKNNSSPVTMNGSLHPGSLKTFKSFIYGLAVLLICAGYSAWAGTFIGADNSQLEPSFVLHSPNYSGTGATNTVTVCIDPTSAFATEMEISIRNSITIWNDLLGTTNNLKFDSDNNIPSDQLDFESSALHELGHCLGLGHTNIGNAGAGGNDNATNSLPGTNNVYEFDSGTDGITGSADDLRGDDINLHWFDTTANDPCSASGNIIDSTTYARGNASLPGGSTFAANSDRDVCAALGHANTEASMNQLTFFDEAQRTLGHDDAATIKYAQSGLDEVQGTSDDYTSVLVYGGMTTTGCDVIAKFDATQTSFAVCGVGFNFPNFPDLTHGTVTLGEMFFNPTVNWFFNDQLIGAPVDTDGDQITDDLDSCTLVANFDQRDTNNDGYGNVCDPDINNDGVVNFGDVSAWVPFFNTANNGDEDFNGDGFVNFGDFSLFPVYFLSPPGPSGIAP